MALRRRISQLAQRPQPPCITGFHCHLIEVCIYPVGSDHHANALPGY